MKQKKLVQLAAVAVAAAVALCSAARVPVSAARTVDDIKAEQQALEERQEELKAQIEELEDQAATSLEYQQKLEEQIRVVESQITAATKDVRELDDGISELDRQIKASEGDYQDTLELLKERIKALYKGGNISVLEILLNSQSLTDYSIRSELIQSVTRHDKELMEKISAKMKETAAQRKELQEKKELLAELKKSLETKGQELKALEEENQKTIETLKANKLLAEDDLQKSYEYGDDLANEMAALIAQMAAAEEAKKPKPTPTPEPKPEDPEDPENPEDPEHPEDPEDPEPEDPAEDPVEGNVSSFGFQWPCPGYVMISAGWMGYPGHKGLDMAAPYGTPIYAAAAGTVMMANDYDEWGDSWGYYVSIYHNTTFSTLYAHCSSLTVSSGEYVEQGQLIGYVGTTGNTTGPHLHFEVYVNGVRDNPMNYL